MKSTSGISIRSIVAASALSGTFSRDISTAAPSLVVPSTALPLCVGHPAGKEGQLTLSLSHNFGPLINQLGGLVGLIRPRCFFSVPLVWVLLVLQELMLVEPGCSSGISLTCASHHVQQWGRRLSTTTEDISAPTGQNLGDFVEVSRRYFDLDDIFSIAMPVCS